MKILGYSGIDNSIAFRKEKHKNFEDSEYKIAQGMDSAVTLINNGKVIAAVEEERFTGEKHTCKFPINSINYCLQAADFNISDIDYIAHGFNYTGLEKYYASDSYFKELYKNVLHPNVQKQLLFENFGYFKAKFYPVSHHLAHAASTFFPSKFKESLILVADGLGELESISIFYAISDKIKLLKKYDLYSSLGLLYSLFTMQLGFMPNNDEYKVMGLAPFGDPNRYASKFSKCIRLTEKGDIFIPILTKNKTLIDKLTYRKTREWIADNICQQQFQQNCKYSQAYRDVAAGLQSLLNTGILHILRYWQSMTQAKKLCYAGGVALNCTTNSKIFYSNLFEEIYVQPASHDAGVSLGAALYCQYSLNNKSENKFIKNELPYYGPDYKEEEIISSIEKYKNYITFKKLNEDEVIEDVVQSILRGEVIAWMYGRMEFGPRALGHRSILADPRSPHMKDKINSIVKLRESFRPFAPSVKFEKAHIFFDITEGQEFPFMLFTVNVREQYKNLLPAITHVDGSARIQTVNKSRSERYWKLLDKFEEKTNIPILLNTSFNIKGQPIIKDPLIAIETFLKIKLDACYIDNYIIRKK